MEVDDMRVVLIGATGKDGRPLLRELLDRGHEVLAVARHAENLRPEFGDVQVREGDIFDPGFVRSLLPDADVLITSVRMKDPAQQHGPVLELHRMLMDAVAAPGVRWIAMGGAGELLLDADGRSSIADLDLAVAVVDEVERGAYVGKRLHVAY
jgi:hypothetical protein